MPAPFGSYDWLKETGGVIASRRGRGAVVLRTYRQAPLAVSHRIRAEVWRRRPSKGHISFDWTTHQASGTARQVETRATELLSSTPMLNHSWRTWVFGCALAERDGTEIDRDLLFIAAMLHDVGLSQPTPGRCFTGRGADLVVELAAGELNDADLAATASAITHHITPGLTKKEGGELGYYLQAGSALDLGGLRAIRLPVDYVRRACDRWPFDGVNVEAGTRWRKEAQMVKHGRAHLLQRWARFSAISRFTPLPP